MRAVTLTLLKQNVENWAENYKKGKLELDEGFGLEHKIYFNWEEILQKLLWKKYFFPFELSL